MWSFLANLLAKLLQPFLFIWKGKQEGKKEARLEGLEEEKRRVEQGNKAVATDDLSPDERLRRNDQYWNN